MNNNNTSIIETLEGRTLRSASPMNFDLNRDARIDGEDCWYVDANMGQQVSGWANGDINGDGSVTQDDATLLGNALVEFKLGHDSIQLDSETTVSLLLLPGDADGNGSIDGEDYWYMDSGPLGRSGTWADGDFNGDGTVDQTDYIIINATVDTDECGRIINGEEWWELDSSGATPFVEAYYA
jgi:hypothetical protein